MTKLLWTLFCLCSCLLVIPRELQQESSYAPGPETISTVTLLSMLQQWATRFRRGEFWPPSALFLVLGYSSVLVLPGRLGRPHTVCSYKLEAPLPNADNHRSNTYLDRASSQEADRGYRLPACVGWLLEILFRQGHISPSEQYL